MPHRPAKNAKDFVENLQALDDNCPISDEEAAELLAESGETVQRVRQSLNELPN